MKNGIKFLLGMLALIVGGSFAEAKGKSTSLVTEDPTWFQVTSPVLMPAKFITGIYPPAGYAPGVSTPNYASSDGKVIEPGVDVLVKWHLHVGQSGIKGKTDVIDSIVYIVNGQFLGRKALPNGGVYGDYDIEDIVHIPNNGYYNSYFLPYGIGVGYNWNAIAPEIHSSVTNGIGNAAFFVGVPAN